MKKLFLKVLISVIVGTFLMLLTLFFNFLGGGDVNAYGLPLPFVKMIWGMGYETNIIYPFLLVDLIVWGLFSYFIIFKLIFKKK